MKPLGILLSLLLLVSGSVGTADAQSSPVRADGGIRFTVLDRDSLRGQYAPQSPHSLALPTPGVERSFLNHESGLSVREGSADRLQAIMSAEGKMTPHRVTMQRSVSGVWENIQRFVYTLDSTGTACEVLRQTWSGGEWTNSTKRIRVQYVPGDTTIWVELLWSGGVFANGQRDILIYAGHSTPIELVRQTWSEGEWRNSWRQLSTLDGYDQTLLWIQQIWSSGSWTNDVRRQYDRSGQQCFREDYSSWVNGAWQYWWEVFYSYSGGVVVEKLKHDWDPDSSKWEEFDSRTTCSYGGPTVESIYYDRHDDPTWIKFGRSIEEYTNSSYEYLLRYKYQAWNDEFGWLYVWAYSVHYDSDMNVLREVTQNARGTGLDDSWVDVNRTVYQYGVILSPKEDEVWIAGEQDTVRWKDVWQGKTLDIEYSTDGGDSYNSVATGVAGDSCAFVWDASKDIISAECTIRINDRTNGSELAESDQFKMKPYVLTRKDATTGELIAYDMASDRWGFGNFPDDMFPVSWYSQFNYRGIDPFTGDTYSQIQAGGLFSKAKPEDFPDWVSFVNTFTVDACYWSVTHRIYSPTALSLWAGTKGIWRGSCFGIAISNALAFRLREDFQDHYREFPVFGDPIEVTTSAGTKSVVNELFTHQYGNPHWQWATFMMNSEKPGQTLAEIKMMLREEVVPLRVLSLWNNGGGGGHTVVPYKLERFEGLSGVFKLRVYDSNHPSDTTAHVLIDSAADGGHGSWVYTRLPGWGGMWRLALGDVLNLYLTPPTLSKQGGRTSPFVLDSSEVHLYTRTATTVIIEDQGGTRTGYAGDTLMTGIPGSAPLIALDGSESPPYGYMVPSGKYSLEMTDFTDSTARLTVRTGNRTIILEHPGATAGQKDRFIYDGGVSIMNPDSVTKSITLMSIINRPTDERLFLVRSLALSRGDSVTIENADEEKLRLLSTGIAKSYDLELNSVSEAELSMFQRTGIPLEANSSHLLVPDWTHLDGSQIVILVDRGNDGTVDDTLRLQDDVTGADVRGSLIPHEYRLEQNYPNPFNPVTTIRYGLPQTSQVRLTVHNLLGQEVATLVNEEKEAGYHEVRFDGSALASGVYIYRVQAGSFVQAKKLVLLK